MASNDIGDWYRGIPQMTKYWFTGSIDRRATCCKTWTYQPSALDTYF